ncbi:MAG: muconate cycloisomerase [Rhodobacteraceae bacterium HLUCCA08]|nr:MAG: muconate cycloisomerase [Rhodobacteraceae bacterium HLUCCA08]
MKLADLTLDDRFIPFRESYGISSAAFTGETFLVARLTCEDGSTGLADSVNAVPFGPESPATMREVLVSHLMPAIRGLDPRDTALIAARMEAAIPGHPMAKAVIDIACHDLAARAAGLPLWRHLGGAHRTEVSFAGSVGISTTERMEAEAADFVARGARTVKVKIGTDPTTDLDRVRAIRAAIGPGINLRLDANQGCRLADWLPTCRKMEACDPEFLEQPLPVWDIAGTARLVEALDTPILIDEGIYTAHDLMALIRAGAVGAVNIKLLKTGLTGARDLAAIARAADLPIVVGSMFETGIGTAASLHFAATLPGPLACTEIGFPTKLTEDVLPASPYLDSPAGFTWPCPTSAGLGVSF